MEETKYAFVDIPESAFPFTVRYFDIDTDAMIREQTVEGPGALKVFKKPDDVREVRVVITWADGRQSVAG